jgi:hypothetical protein
MIKSRRMTWSGHIAFGILKVKPDGKIPIGKPRRRWEDITRMIIIIRIIVLQFIL